MSRHSNKEEDYSQVDGSSIRPSRSGRMYTYVFCPPIHHPTQVISGIDQRIRNAEVKVFNNNLDPRAVPKLTSSEIDAALDFLLGDPRTLNTTEFGVESTTTVIVGISCTRSVLNDQHQDGLIETIQLCHWDRIIIFLSITNSGLCEHENFISFLENRSSRFRHFQFIFTGVDLAIDALDMVLQQGGRRLFGDNSSSMHAAAAAAASPRLHGAIDVAKIVSIGQAKTLGKQTDGEIIASNDLASIFNSVFSSKWERPNDALAGSFLSMIRDCAAAAFASSLVGLYSLELVGALQLPRYRREKMSIALRTAQPFIFSLRDASMKLLLLCKSLLEQNATLRDTKKQNDYEVIVNKMHCNSQKTFLCIELASYKSRCVLGQLVTAVLTLRREEQSERCRPEVFIGLVTCVQGTYCELEFRFVLDSHDNKLMIDSQTERNRIHSMLETTFQLNKDCITLVTNNTTSKDLPLKETNVLIKNIIRNHTIDTFSSQGTFGLVRQEIHPDARLAVNILLGSPLWEASSTLPLSNPVLEAIKHHSVGLNAAQSNALTNAHLKLLSAVRGPAGTGKTKTIAAIAQSMVDLKQRCLIIAPANAGALRVLQTVVSSGYKNAALIVVKGFYFDWHEENYSSDLQEYVVTPIKVDKAAEKELSEAGGGGGQARKKLTEKHVSKWNASSAKPQISILTYGAAISGELLERNSNWYANIGEIVQWDTIDAVIVDETSQLWAGHAFSLLSRFSNAKKFVIVGDEQQLPPYGADKGRSGLGIKSMFDCIVEHPQVTTQLLNVSYRLPPRIGTLLSNYLYAGSMSFSRKNDVDMRVRQILAEGARALPHRPSSLATKYYFGSKDSEDDAMPAAHNWLHVVCAPIKSKDTGSFYNVDEAEVIANMACDILTIFASVPGVERQSLGLRLAVITPYEAQRGRIERLLANKLATASTRSPNKIPSTQEDDTALALVRSSRIVNCIDGYQGQEASVVLVSLARNAGLGFLKDNRRVNVMCSRCQNLMVLVGDVFAFLYEMPGKHLLARVAQDCIEGNLIAEFNKAKTILQPLSKRFSSAHPLVGSFDSSSMANSSTSSTSSSSSSKSSSSSASSFSTSASSSSSSFSTYSSSSSSTISRILASAIVVRAPLSTSESQSGPSFVNSINSTEEKQHNRGRSLHREPSRRHQGLERVFDITGVEEKEGDKENNNSSGNLVTGDQVQDPVEKKQKEGVWQQANDRRRPGRGHAMLFQARSLSRSPVRSPIRGKESNAEAAATATAAAAEALALALVEAAQNVLKTHNEPLTNTRLGSLLPEKIRLVFFYHFIYYCLPLSLLFLSFLLLLTKTGVRMIVAACSE